MDKCAADVILFLDNFVHEYLNSHPLPTATIGGGRATFFNGKLLESTPAERLDPTVTNVQQHAKVSADMIRTLYDSSNLLSRLPPVAPACDRVARQDTVVSSLVPLQVHGALGVSVPGREYHDEQRDRIGRHFVRPGHARRASRAHAVVVGTSRCGSVATLAATAARAVLVGAVEVAVRRYVQKHNQRSQFGGAGASRSSVREVGCC